MNTVKIGWIGLGNMGKPMAKHLTDAGFNVSVFNRNKAKNILAEEMGASVCGNASALAMQCDVVFLMVSDDNATREIFEGANGLFSAEMKDKIFINSSTVSPAISKDLAEKCLQKGAYYLDAPVAGSVKQAVEASLVIMVGGDENIFQQTKYILEKLGKTVLYIGSAGAGNALKLVVNTQLAIYGQSLAEAVLFARKNKISAKHLLAVLNNSSMANVLMKLKGDMILNDDYAPAFALKLLTKDLGLAKDLGLNSPLGNAAFETYQKANEQFADEDMIAVIKGLN